MVSLGLSANLEECTDGVVATYSRQRVVSGSRRLQPERYLGIRAEREQMDPKNVVCGHGRR